MSRIFITGSSDGLGFMAAKRLVEKGHQVVLHARNTERGQDALDRLPGAKTVLTADLSNIEETKQLARQVNTLGCFDAIIHNAGVYRVSDTVIFAVNSLAPFILTALIQKPRRLIYLSSGMHLQGNLRLEHLSARNQYCTYADSKLHVLLLGLAVSRKWKDVFSNTVNPGWVPTKMGGTNAPDDLDKGAETQVWLAESNDTAARVTGRYFHHQKEQRYLPGAADANIQEKFIALCEEVSGVPFPIG